MVSMESILSVAMLNNFHSTAIINFQGYNKNVLDKELLLLKSKFRDFLIYHLFTCLIA